MTAFNVGLSVDQILAADEEDLARQVIVATDDLGNRVTKLPVADGAIAAWFDFSSNRIEFDVEGDEIEVWNFVYQIIYGLVNQMIPQRKRFRTFDLESADGLVLRRVSWEHSLKAWYFRFDYPEER